MSEPKLEEWGKWLCSFFDPEGNESDLKQPKAPAMPGDGRGAKVLDAPGR